MDFFQRQDQARKNTKFLVFYFAAAVIGIILALYLAALLVFNGAQAKRHRSSYDENRQPQIVLWDSRLFLGVSLATLAVVGCGCAYKISELASGGSAVAESLGGRLVNPNTTDPDERKLLNVVEEMAIASGVPMPQVYLLHWENGINAFAAGHTPSDAAIAVTRGCIKILSRDELQGVIGHEFSHILNGDMKLNLRLVGILFGILCLTIVGRILLRARGRNNGLPVAIGLLLLVIGSIGVFFGRLIQAAVSRQREFLADASSVQFTRNPGGITGALKKIGGLGENGSSLGTAHAGEASHMFFANGISAPLMGLLETHPPLVERIRAIDPAFDGKFPFVRYAEGEQLREEASKPSRSSTPNMFGTMLGGAILASGEAGKPPVIKSAAVLPNLGNPTPLHLRYAEQFRNTIPDEIKSAVREPLGAVALVFTLLLDEDDPLRRTQLDELSRRFPAVQPQVIALLKLVTSVATPARLPLVSLALPALRQLRPAEYKQFSETLTWLIESDRQIDLFEFALQKILNRHLEPQFGKTRRGVVQYYSIKPLMPDCSLLLSALARVGSSDETENAAAVQKGAPYLRAPEGDVVLQSREECGLDKVDAALDRLVQAAPQIKKNVIEACAQVVAADGVMQEHEGELLRAFADTLDCPMPPFVTAE